MSNLRYDNIKRMTKKKRVLSNVNDYDMFQEVIMDLNRLQTLERYLEGLKDKGIENEYINKVGEIINMHTKPHICQDSNDNKWDYDLW